MPILTYTNGARFIFRITKFHNANPDRKWANTYEFVAAGSGAETNLLALGTTLVQFESAIHYGAILFDRLLISTWEEDSHPYDPNTLIASPLTAAGSLTSLGTQVEPINFCFDVRRFCPSGRYGHIFYRGALAESDVEAPSGRAQLADRAAMQGRIDDAISSSGLDAYIGVGGGDFALSLISKDGTSARTVLSLQAAGVSVVPYNHKWFNRHPGLIS